jgi:hypothetical protein
MTETITTPPTRFEVCALGTYNILQRLIYDAFAGTISMLGCFICMADETGTITQKIGTFSSANAIEGELTNCTDKITLLVQHKDFLSSSQVNLRIEVRYAQSPEKSSPSRAYRQADGMRHWQL